MFNDDRLQPGWLDRVFNSTISLPQQVVWRVWRAMEDEDIDIFSEKGLLDAALIPGLGVFDDHKEDVMPDYMAEQMGLAKKGESKFGSQLSAAILSDPLTYMTGGLTAIGKLGKTATLAKRAPALKKVIREVAEGEGKNLDQYMKGLAPEKFVGHIDEALDAARALPTEQAGRQVKHLEKMRKSFTQTLPKAERLHRTSVLGEAAGPVHPLTLSGAVKSTRDRQISIGLPIFHRWGAKYDVAEGYSSWWQLYKDGVNKGGTKMAKALLLHKLVDMPGVGMALKSAAAPALHFRGGWQIGREAQTALSHHKGLLPDEAEGLAKWLSPDGAAPIAQQTNVATDLIGQEEVVKRLRDAYEESIKGKRGMSHEEAFKFAFNSIGIGKRGESGTALYGRLTGNLKDNTFFPKWGAGASEGKSKIEGILTKAMEQHAKASKLHQQGKGAIVPTDTAHKLVADVFQTKAEDLGPAFEAIAKSAFETGQKAKAAWNTVFRTGQSTLAGEKAYEDFISNVARDNDQLELIAKSLFTKLRELTDGQSTLSSNDVSKLVEKISQMSAMPGEVTAAFRVADINPKHMGKVLASMENFLVRQRRSMLGIQKLLKKGGIGDQATRDKLLDAFNDEIFPFLETEGKWAGGNKQQSLVGTFNRLLKNTREEQLTFTPHQQTLMRRVNNKHLIIGEDLPLTTRQLAAQKGGKNVTPGRVLEKYEGRQAGTLEVDELDDALGELQRAGQRGLTQDEILEAAELMHPVQQFAKHLARGSNPLTTSEVISLLSKQGKSTKRLVPRKVSERPKLWKADRTRWRATDVEATAKPYGFRLVQDEETGLFNFLSTKVKESTLRRHYGYKAHKGYRTYNEAMQGLRGFLSSSTKYTELHGPGFQDVARKLEIPTSEIEDLRVLLSADDLKVLQGKSTVFDDATLSPELLRQQGRLTKLKARRALPKKHKLHDAPIIPRKDKVVTQTSLPRTGKELKLHMESEGLHFEEAEMSSWASNYARGRILIREVINGIRRAQKHKTAIEIDPNILADIERHVDATGSIVRNIMTSHLPKEFNEMFSLADDMARFSDEAAKRSGVWMPGSPIAYLPRFFNKAARARIAQLMGDIEQADGGLLVRLGVRQAQYFRRSWDQMPMEDLDELFYELRTAMQETGASPEMAKFHARLDKEMGMAGITVTGMSKKMPWLKKERLEHDPFLSLMQRFGVAQQDANLEKYFDNMLAASTGKNGDSMMLGGKVVGIVDDTGNIQSLPHKTYKVRSTKRLKDSEEISLVEETANFEHAPKSLMIELEDGTMHTVENGMFSDTGFSLLGLGKVGDAAELGYTPTVVRSFTRASQNSSLHESLISNPLSAGMAQDLLGNHVVLGSQHNIVGMAKTAARVHKVTAPALRTFDAINYGIKSFQTIFRLPFHIANLSSGVFQSHLAGATPKNLLASYIDTMRFLAGDQAFAKKASMVNDLLDLGSDASSLGISNLARGNKSLLQEATRMHGGGGFDDFLRRQRGGYDDLDAVEDLVIPLQDGSELDMREFIQTAGEMQLYGTFASSMTRGSRTVAENLVRIKLQTLEPSFGGRFLGAPKSLVKKMGNLAETSEVINRTATALALVREGHPIRRAIEIAKEAHVPYEKLTPFERNAFKRFSVYYTFPRHYMPWAWSRFAEDPAKLANISHFIRDQQHLTTQEGKPNLVVGDYRVDLGRLNANFEAAGMMAAFADRLAMPAVEAFVPGVDGYDNRKLRSVYSDAGITNIGGIAGMALGNNILRDPDRDPPENSIWEEATRVAWPLKLVAQLAGKAPKEGLGALITNSKDERSPYVEYTGLESWLNDSVIGIGTRKVRDKHELRRANMAYRRIVKKLQMRALATESPETRDRLLGHVKEISLGMRQIFSESKQKDK